MFSFHLHSTATFGGCLIQFILGLSASRLPRAALEKCAKGFAWWVERSTPTGPMSEVWTLVIAGETGRTLNDWGTASMTAQQNTPRRTVFGRVTRAAVFAITSLITVPPTVMPTWANGTLYATTATLAATPSPSGFGQAVELNATIDTLGKPAASGNVTFKDGTADLGVAQLQALGVSVAQMAAAGEHTCALSTSKRVWCWGNGGSGQLGYGTTTSFNSTPTLLPDLFDVTTVAAGRDHTCALNSSGAVFCWGRGFEGQLGNGSYSSSHTPVLVSGLSRSTALAAGGSHTCAVTSAGKVYCWGRGFEGQLGTGGIGSHNAPFEVSSLSGAMALAAGDFHTCALMAVGGVRCWGYGGLLGNGSYSSSLSPVSVAGLSGTKALAAGRLHTCALNLGGGVSCWGRGNEGQLGHGVLSNMTTPVAVQGLSGVTALTGGGFHTCALISGGATSCWGWNSRGQLGNGSTSATSVPVTVSGFSSAVTLAAGGDHTCALTSNGEVSCWGWNGNGQLGIQSAGFYTTPSILTEYNVLNRAVATLSTDALKQGIRQLWASFTETATHQSAIGTLNHTVGGYATNTTIVSDANPSPFDTPVTFTATVTSSNGTPAGTVTFRNGLNVLDTVPLFDGVAELVAGDLPVGTASITARYNGSSEHFQSNSGAVAQTITRGTQSISLDLPGPQNFIYMKNFGVYANASSGLDVTLASLTPDVCFIWTQIFIGGGSARYLRILSPGICSIKASVNGNSQYFSSQLTQSFEITAALSPEGSALAASSRRHEQGFASLAPFGTGAVMAYASRSTAAGPFGIMRQNLSSTGAANGLPMVVAAPAAGVSEPDVAVLMSGHVIVWQAPDGSGTGIFAQRFTAAGAKINRVFRVNAAVVGSQSRPRVAPLPGGGFAVVWQTMVNMTDEDVWLRVFNASGAPLTGDVRVNTTTVRKQNSPDIAALATGTIAVTWASERAAGRFDVHHRLFRASGAPLTTQATTASLNQRLNPVPVIAAQTRTGEDRFPVAFAQSEVSSAATPADISVKMVSALGVASTATVKANSVKAGHQSSPAITTLKAGGFAVAFTTPDGSLTGIGLRYFYPVGDAIGREVRVNSKVAGAQFAPALTPLGPAGPTRGTTFLGAWTTPSTIAANRNDIAARLFQGQ